jgi:hypothetical protein
MVPPGFRRVFCPVDKERDFVQASQTVVQTVSDDDVVLLLKFNLSNVRLDPPYINIDK